MRWVAAVAATCLLGMVVVMFAIVAAFSGSPTFASQPILANVGDIPPTYLALYQQAAEQTGIDWAILAAIGSVETDHGRSSAPGVRSGVNSYGCCAGPMQFNVRNGPPSTWQSYGAGGSVYDPADAIPAAARYLVANGAPTDYHRAILAYNHAEWYVSDVMAKADEYRAAAQNVGGAGSDSGPVGADWLVVVPGTGIECDKRIVPDVLMILNRFHAQLNACYAPTGHKAAGEHPLGLAVDLVPAPPAGWGMMASLARFAGWRPECASTGCASQTHTVFRFVGYNGYPGHGDPAHAGANAHLHLSWNHGAGLPAASVRVLSGS
jgi:hypothetical protein